jgi:hypothetical protein
MKANQNMERIYELIEQFDFNELSESDKAYILTLISETEYNNMRNTLKDTENYFAQTLEPKLNDPAKFIPDQSKNENRIIKLLKQPIQLYKVAASIVVILGIYSLIHYSNQQQKSNLLAVHDTIIIHKTDTVYSKLVDTIRIIKEKIVYVPQKQELLASNKILSDSKNVSDCNKEICPADLDKIKAMTYNNNVSHDKLLTGFIVSIK